MASETFPDNIITLDTIYKLNDFFSGYNKAIIFGKGPTFANKSKNNDQSLLHVGINNAVNYLDECDMLTLNDIETVDMIDDNVYTKIKYILIPEYPQKCQKFNKNITWRLLYDKIKDIYTGYIIVYNLKTNPNPNNKLLTLSTGVTSSNTANEFLCKYLREYISHVDFYGVGIKDRSGHHDIFNNSDKSGYPNQFLAIIKKDMIRICDKYLMCYSFY
jgi:hypothetical protein